MKHRLIVIALAVIVFLSAAVPRAVFQIVPLSDAAETPANISGESANPGGSRARQDVLDILQRPEYSRWKPQVLEAEKDEGDGAVSRSVLSFFELCGKAIAKLWNAISGPVGDFFHKIWDWFKRLLPSRSATSPTGPNFNLGTGTDYGFILRCIGWVLLAIVVIALAILLFKRMRGGPRQGRSARVLSREQVRSALETGEALALDGHEWVEQAEKLLAEKDLRAVYRALYLAMLAGLHSSGKIDFRQTRTNWFYVGRFKGAEGDRGLFSELTELFDEVWYGNRTGRIDEVSRVKAKVLSLVGNAPAADAQSPPANQNRRSGHA